MPCSTVPKVLTNIFSFLLFRSSFPKVLTKLGGFKIIMMWDLNNKERKKIKTMMKGVLGKKIVYYLNDIPYPEYLRASKSLGPVSPAR